MHTDGGRLTYRTWMERATAVAHGLAAKGVERGARVLVPFEGDWLAYPIAYMGVQWAGAVPVLVTRAQGPEHARQAYAASGAVGVIAALPIAGCGAWTASVQTLEIGRPISKPPHEPQADDAAEMTYTSGTTGVPRCVVATHASTTAAVGRRAGERRAALHALPGATTVGQGLMMQTLSEAPSTMIAGAQFDAAEIVQAITAQRPTDLVIVPAMADALVREVHRAGASADVSSLRVVRTTSAPITPTALATLAQAFPDAAVVNMYSTTESWPARLRIKYDPERPGALGRPEGTTEVRVIGEDGEPAAAGVSGDVQLRAANAPQRSYHGDADASAAVFLADGWVRTGDRGHLDADGYFHLDGRNADLVISGGQNVSALAVEAAVAELAGVVEVAVVGLPHPVLGESVVAAVITDGGPFDEDQARGTLEDRLGSAAPTRIVTVADFPRTSLGKVIKGRLREELTGQFAVPDDGTPPQTPTEKRLAAIWSEVLGAPVETTGADFVMLGGSSLNASKVTARVRDELGKAIRLRDLFAARSLADYARLVDEADAASGPVPARISRLPRRMEDQ